MTPLLPLYYKNLKEDDLLIKYYNNVYIFKYYKQYNIITCDYWCFNKHICLYTNIKHIIDFILPFFDSKTLLRIERFIFESKI